MTKKTTIRELLHVCMKSWGDDPKNIIGSTDPDIGFDKPIKIGYGNICDRDTVEFVVWTVDRIYFPNVYDGYLTIRSVPRHPNSQEKMATGGG